VQDAVELEVIAARVEHHALALICIRGALGTDGLPPLRQKARLRAEGEDDAVGCSVYYLDAVSGRDLLFADEYGRIYPLAGDYQAGASSEFARSSSVMRVYQEAWVQALDAKPS
jgi:hypothetical protein